MLIQKKGKRKVCHLTQRKKAVLSSPSKISKLQSTPLLTTALPPKNSILSDLVYFHPKPI